MGVVGAGEDRGEEGRGEGSYTLGCKESQLMLLDLQVVHLPKTWLMCFGVANWERETHSWTLNSAKVDSGLRPYESSTPTPRNWLSPRNWLTQADAHGLLHANVRRHTSDDEDDDEDEEKEKEDEDECDVLVVVRNTKHMC